MERFWDFVELVAILLTILVGVFFVISAFSKEPGNIVRGLMSGFGRALGWIVGVFMLAVSACGGVYAVMPVDFLPEALLPVIGLIDDLIVIPLSMCTGTTGILTLVGLKLSSPKKDSPKLEKPKDSDKLLDR